MNSFPMSIKVGVRRYLRATVTWCPDDATELCSLRKQKRKKLKKVFNNGTVASAPSFFLKVLVVGKQYNIRSGTPWYSYFKSNYHL